MTKLFNTNSVIGKYSYGLIVFILGGAAALASIFFIAGIAGDLLGTVLWSLTLAHLFFVWRDTTASPLKTSA